MSVCPPLPFPLLQSMHSPEQALFHSMIIWLTMPFWSMHRWGVGGAAQAGATSSASGDYTTPLFSPYNVMSFSCFQ